MRRWVATAVSGLFGRGQRLWSEKMGGGRERQTLQTRRGRAEPLQPPGRVCQAEWERWGSMALGKFIPEKPGILGGWETGETEATVQVPSNPRRGMSISQAPHTGRIRLSCSRVWGRP